jgi:hypothetical protein
MPLNEKGKTIDFDAKNKYAQDKNITRRNLINKHADNGRAILNIGGYLNLALKVGFAVT